LYYAYGGGRIADGLGYSDDVWVDGAAVWHPWCHYPVGYSAFLAGFYRLFGDGARVTACANALVGALLALVTWALARQALSESRARIAGLLVAFHPGLNVYSALVMTEQLAALITLTAFWIAAGDRSPSMRRMRGLVLGALVLGVGALVRPQALLCAPFLALVLLRPAEERLPLRRLGAGAILACVLALVPVLPWTARNCAVMDGCALVSTNGGWNLAIGSFPRANGRFQTLHASDGCREVTGQVQQDRCWLAYGIAQIRESPRHWLSLVPAKLGYTFDHESFAIEYLHEGRPQKWPEPTRVLGRSILTTFHRLLLCVAVLSCLAFRARGRATGQVLVGVVALILTWLACGDAPVFWPLAVFVAVVPWLPIPGHPEWPPALLLPIVLLGSTIATHAVFFGEDRYHIVVSPVLCLLAAAALRKPQTRAHKTTARHAASEDEAHRTTVEESAVEESSEPKPARG
jgi:4-amino-4-deoxy-L-arabinose transferase-like glycosyltransferase